LISWRRRPRWETWTKFSPFSRRRNDDDDDDEARVERGAEVCDALPENCWLSHVLREREREDAPAGQKCANCRADACINHDLKMQSGHSTPLHSRRRWLGRPVFFLLRLETECERVPVPPGIWRQKVHENLSIVGWRDGGEYRRRHRSSGFSINLKGKKLSRR